LDAGAACVVEGIVVESKEQETGGIVVESKEQETGGIVVESKEQETGVFIGGGGGGQQTGRGMGGAGACGGSLENLHAMVAEVSHHDAPVAVDGNAAFRAVETSVA